MKHLFLSLFCLFSIVGCQEKIEDKFVQPATPDFQPVEKTASLPATWNFSNAMSRKYYFEKKNHVVVSNAREKDESDFTLQGYADFHPSRVSGGGKLVLLESVEVSEDEGTVEKRDTFLLEFDETGKMVGTDNDPNACPLLMITPGIDGGLGPGETVSIEIEETVRGSEKISGEKKVEVLGYGTVNGKSTMKARVSLNVDMDKKMKLSGETEVLFDLDRGLLLEADGNFVLNANLGLARMKLTSDILLRLIPEAATP